MNLHLKHFATHAEYEAYISGGGVLPNVSLCEDEYHVHFNPVKTYEAVDLGLPSGKKWAKCNIGAENETDYGDYFMWGGTTPVTNNTCDWPYAPFNNGQRNFDEEYFNAHKSEWLDGDVLKPEYDAAHVIMGGNWRMPTKTDCEELLECTTNKWVTNYQDSGVNGSLFTSDNGNTIFIPAAGRRIGSSFEYRGNSGYVWSSLLRTDGSDSAWILYFTSYSYMSNNYHNYGLSVRGVMKL